MLKQIKSKLKKFRRLSFPPSYSTTKKQHATLIGRLDSIDHKLDSIGHKLDSIDKLEGIDHKLSSLEEVLKTLSGLEFLLAIAPGQVSSLLGYLKHSNSQIWQDIFVLAELNLKRNGFFVEFGACNGIDLSNTYLLEKQFGWTGILAEPAKCWHSALHANRKSVIETKCVWSKSKMTLNFSETDAPEFSTINSYISSDLHEGIRKKCNTYSVETISLLDMLEKYNAPRVIDYITIDTEGSEYEILEHFDFEKYQFRLITCEHNFTDRRDSMHRLLSSEGYQRKFEHLSQWDDWYVKL